MLNRVTVTGADDSVRPEDLVVLQRDFPWVEWGILVGSSHGDLRPRFPGSSWLARLVEVARADGLNLSVHLCGRPVREVCEMAVPPVVVVEAAAKGLHESCQRVQLNFHGMYHRLNERFWHQGGDGKQYILQDDGKNDDILGRLCGDKTKDFVPLFDLSGGAGVLPEKGWPPPRTQRYQGYAGGLSPENVARQIPKIALAAGSVNHWIDVETRVRSRDDEVFDLGLVRDFLETAAPFVGK